MLQGYVSFFEDILFVEGNVTGANMLGSVQVDLSFKIGAHFKNLNDVKLDLVRQCRQFGGNCVCQFKYGQKSRWLAIDDVAFFGSGMACFVSPEDYNAAVEKVKAR